MKEFMSLQLSGAAVLVLTICSAQAGPRPTTPLLSSNQVEAALKGMLCTTRAGAKFTFTSDGHYAYSGGLGWEQYGHYWAHEGAVSVLFDSGLGRSFAISAEGDVLYMQETAVRCGPIDDKKVSSSNAR